jgi:mRNA interferase MazF
VTRGDVWTAAGNGDYIGRPRPVVIVQDDEQFDATDSITICPLTTTVIDAPLFRLSVVPSAGNGLDIPSFMMVDKTTTIEKRKLGTRLGALGDDDITRLNQALMVFFGLAGSGRAAEPSTPTE